MKGKELGKLICIDCIFAVLIFAYTYFIGRGQAFVSTEILEHLYFGDINYMIIGSLGEIARIAFYPLFSLFHAYIIYRLVQCPNIKRLIILNSIVFCVVVVAVSSSPAMLHAIDFYVILYMPSNSVSVMITQIALALLFIRNDKGALSAVDRSV